MNKRPDAAARDHGAHERVGLPFSPNFYPTVIHWNHKMSARIEERGESTRRFRYLRDTGGGKAFKGNW
jgi:hypothetical protein